MPGRKVSRGDRGSTVSPAFFGGRVGGRPRRKGFLGPMDRTHVCRTNRPGLASPSPRPEASPGDHTSRDDGLRHQRQPSGPPRQSIEVPHRRVSKRSGSYAQTVHRGDTAGALATDHQAQDEHHAVATSMAQPVLQKSYK